MSGTKPITLCIVDDIRSVVEGITSIGWDSRGIAVAGTATTGEDGLELVRRVQPDILITDIRMPKMDGLSMLRAILEEHGCKVILISGYTDFEYAKEALQLGVFNFVVKPFTEGDIVDVVMQAKALVEEERSQLLDTRAMEQKVRESLPLLRQEYFALQVAYRTTPEQAVKRWEFLEADLAPRGFVVMILEIDGFAERVADLSVRDVELVRFSLQNIVEETIREHTRCVVFRSQHHRFAAVLNDPASTATARIAEQICSHMERYTKFTVSIGIGGRVETISELPDSYRQADRALAHHLFTDGNGAIGFDELPQADRQPPLALERKDELLLSLRSGNAARAAAILTEVFTALQRMEPKPHPDYLLSLYDELASSAIRALYELAPATETQPLVDRYKAMRGASGLALAALEQHLAALCRDGAELVRNNTLSEGQAIVYKAMDYVQSHLDRDLTLADCAAHVHLSASYFSSLFKKVTGLTVIQYATQERIHKAKALLVGGMPVQEVAAAVGYEERRYFSEMFKKTTGMTPSEFREGYHPEST